MARRGNGSQAPDLPTDISRRRRFPYRRIAGLGLLCLAALGAFIVLNIAKNAYTDWLWFESVGYRSVYTEVLFTRLWLFFSGAALLAAAFLGNVFLAQRLARRNEPSVLPPGTIMVIRGATRMGVAFFTVLLAIVFGLVASHQWENLLLFTHAQPFLDSTGAPLADPIHGHNPSYYVFSLPLVRFTQTWLLGLALVLVLGALAIYAVGFSLRGFRLTFQRGVKVHLSLLFALLAFLVAWSYWIDIQELVFSSRGLGGRLLGANATDATAKLFALRFMIGVTALVAVALAASAVRRGIAAPVACLVGWIASVLFVLWLYPAAYQRFSVQPNELARETPYIERNIRWTREAYGLSKVQVVPLGVTGVSPAEEAVRVPSVTDNLRLWAQRPLGNILNQVQAVRGYYKFLDLDVDRYTLSGEMRVVMVGARELSVDELPAESRGWVARRVQYTHGYGAVMAPVGAVASEGGPKLLIKDAPPSGDLPLTRPEVYYGEKTGHYVIVNARTQEFDYPNEQGPPQLTSHAGGGGVRLSSLLRRAAFAWKFSDINILISHEITPQSRVLFRRNIQNRVRHIAPFLRLDPDPYLVVADGKLWWVQDAYTTTKRFPYARRFEGGFNYMKNSVKVVVDAYDGAVDFYVADPRDAILQAYARSFPGLFKPLEAMPPSLRAHLKYPDELFNVQATMYQTYHVTAPRVWFSKEDFWGRPEEVFYGARRVMEPYHAVMPLPGQGKPEFLLLLPLTTAGRPSVAAFLAARNDGPHYGELVSLAVPPGMPVDGPAQVESRITTDPRISQQFALWAQQGAQVIRGNLLAIPLSGTVLYVEPIYIQSPGSALPELGRVIVAIGPGSPAMEPTLGQALDVAFGRAPASSTGRPAPGATPAPPPRTPDLDSLIKELEKLLEQLRQLRDKR